MEGMLQRLLGDDVRLVTKTGGTALSVRADRGQIEQVLANLAVNARDAMPHGGELHIEVGECQVTADDPKQARDLAPGPYVLLAVSDQGTGMGAEVLSHLFEPFFTTKDQGKGTGLGLSVVYGIVRQTGGDILVESEVGRGSTFRILLPWSGGPSTSGDAGGAPVEAGSATKGQATVLLAEDEEAVRALARDMLQYLGYEVLEASSGDEAIRVFERHRDAIRAIVTDIVMPGMSGVDLARHLVSLKPSLKVLLVSGYTKDSLADGFEEDGFAFLQKPYMLEEIRRGLADLLAGSLAGDAGAPPSRRG